jgi:hypothetical protein
MTEDRRGWNPLIVACRIKVKLLNKHNWNENA